jgi:uncharacterized protein YceK
MNTALKNLLRIFLLTACAVIFNGCSSIRQYSMPDEDNLLSGAGAIAAGVCGNSKSKCTSEFELIDITELLKKHKLLDAQGTYADGSEHSTDFVYKRNDMQDSLIAASNQKCGNYIRMITASKAQSKMAWGGLSTILTTAATVTTPLAAKNALTAGGAMSGSLNTLYDEAYFSSLTTGVISAGIAHKRSALLAAIYQSRQEKASAQAYTVHRAIADALEYHGACNVIAGLEAATTTTTTATAATKAETTAASTKIISGK